MSVSVRLAQRRIHGLLYKQRFVFSKYGSSLASFSTTVLPFKLADIGEGIAEVELMKWFVKVRYPAI